MCAVAALMGFAGCSDDSSSPTPVDGDFLSADTKSITMSADEVKTVAIKHGSSTVKFTNAFDECIQIKSDEVDSSNMTLTITPVGPACSSSIFVNSGSENLTIDVTVQAVAKPGVPIIQVKQNSYTLKPDATDKLQVNYTKDGKGLTGSVLNVASSDESCVQLKSGSITVGENGHGDVEMTAGGSECTATITITSAQGEGATPAKVLVTVSDDDTPQPGEKRILEFLDSKTSELSVSLDSDNLTKKFKVRLTDENAQTVDGTTIRYTVADDTCVKMNATAAKTKDGGTIENTVKAVSGDSLKGCKTTVSIKGSNTNELTLKVDVKPIQEYGMNVTLTADKKKINRLSSAIVYYAENLKCASLIDGNYENNPTANQTGSTEAIIDISGDTLGTASFDVVAVGQTAVYALAYGDEGHTSILASGCVDVDPMDPDVNLPLTIKPTQVTGTYDITANFDIASAFEFSKDQDGKRIVYPVAEKMIAGDWIYFITDFFDKPVDTLFNFLWVNAIDRLVGYVGGTSAPGWVSSILDFVKGNATKALALAYVKPVIENAFKSEGDQGWSWYEILNKVGPDVTDLVTNMQISGKLKINEANVMTDATDGRVKITDASESFSHLAYQWSYVPKGGKAEGCADVYGKSQCRKKMDLSSDAIEGTWVSGLVVEEENYSRLTIDPHELDFKWANILFAAVFGEILPNSLSYTVEESGSQKLYLKSFLGKVLFEPIVNNYVKKIESGEKDTTNNCVNVKVTKEDGTTETKCWPELKTTDPSLKCERFLESVLYMISTEGWMQTAATVLAPWACNQIFAALDGTDGKNGVLLNSLAQFQANATLSSDQCQIYDYTPAPENIITQAYQMIGKPDDGLYTAKEINGGKKTNRCVYDLKFGKNYPMKGYFHGTRTVGSSK